MEDSARCVVTAWSFLLSENFVILSIEAFIMNNEELSVASAIQFAAGFNGSRVVSGTTPVTANFRTFEINSDAVITSLKDKNGNDMMTEMGLTAVVLSTGRYLCAPRGNWFSSITLSSGSIVIYYI